MRDKFQKGFSPFWRTRDTTRDNARQLYFGATRCATIVFCRDIVRVNHKKA
jgi:hypothetical protein